MNEFVFRGVSFLVCLYHLQAMIILPKDKEEECFLMKNQQGVLRLIQEELGREINTVFFYSAVEQGA